jgi:hypothetical protein
MAKALQNFFGGDESVHIVTAYTSVPNAAAAVDQWGWSHPGDGKVYELVDYRVVFGTTSTSGTLMPEKCSGTTAVGSGTDLLTGNASLSGTANTVVSGALVSSASTRKFKSGDRLGHDFGGTVTNFAGGLITMVFRVASY